MKTPKERLEILKATEVQTSLGDLHYRHESATARGYIRVELERSTYQKCLMGL